jgi:hypothetical protein
MAYTTALRSPRRARARPRPAPVAPAPRLAPRPRSRPAAPRRAPPRPAAPRPRAHSPPARSLHPRSPAFARIRPRARSHPPPRSPHAARPHAPPALAHGRPALAPPSARTPARAWENAERALATRVWPLTPSVNRRIAIGLPRHLRDSPTKDHPAWESISARGQPAVAALRVDACAWGCLRPGNLSPLVAQPPPKSISVVALPAGNLSPLVAQPAPKSISAGGAAGPEIYLRRGPCPEIGLHRGPCPLSLRRALTLAGWDACDCRGSVLHVADGAQRLRRILLPERMTAPMNFARTTSRGSRRRACSESRWSPASDARRARPHDVPRRRRRWMIASSVALASIGPSW